MDQVIALLRVYGYVGCLPFVLLALVGTLVDGAPTFWRVAFDTYSAVILSFMAGVCWSVSLRPDSPVDTARLMAGCITLSLLAWVALALPPSLRTLAFITGFALLYGIDRFVLVDVWSPRYVQIRGHLTMMVLLSQGLVLLA